MKKIIALISVINFFYSQNYTVSRIQFIGNYHTKSDFLKNFMYVQEGDVYSLDELKTKAARSEQKLSNTFYFFNNKVSVIPLKNNKAKILVKISEGFLYRFGGDESGLGFGQENVFGKGYSYLVSASPESFGISLKKLYLMNTKFNFGVKFTTHLSNRIDPLKGVMDENFRTTLVDLELGFAFQPDFLVSTFYQHQNTNLKVVGHNDELSIFGSKFIIKSLNNDLFPSDGYMITNYYETYNDRHLNIFKARYFNGITEDLFLSTKLSIANSSGNLDVSRQLQLNHLDGLVAEKYSHYNSNNAGFMTEVQLTQKVATTPPFSSTLYVGVFHQLAKLSNKLDFKDPIQSTGFTIGLFIPNPVLLRIEGKYGFTKSGNTFTFTMGLNLGVINEL